MSTKKTTDSRIVTLIKCKHCNHVWKVRNERRNLTCSGCGRNNNTQDDAVTVQTVNMGGSQ